MRKPAWVNTARLNRNTVLKSESNRNQKSKGVFRIGQLLNLFRSITPYVGVLGISITPTMTGKKIATIKEAMNEKKEQKTTNKTNTANETPGWIEEACVWSERSHFLLCTDRIEIRF